MPGGDLENKDLTPQGVGSVTPWSLSCFLSPSSAAVKRGSVASSSGFSPLERLIRTWGVQSYRICFVAFLLDVSSCFDFLNVENYLK